MKASRIVDDEMTPAIGNAPTLTSLLQVLWRRLWAIVLVAVVLTGSAVGFSLLQTSIYVSSVKVLVGQSGKNLTTNLAGDVQGLQDLTPTMAAAVTTIPVAQAATERLDLPKGSPGVVLDNVSAQPDPPGTMFISISYSDTDPKRAQQIANALGQAFTMKVSEVSPRVNSVTATVWEPATLPLAPVSPSPLRNGMLAFMVGTLLGVGLAFLLEALDHSWMSPEEMEQISGAPIFATIPRV
jgi:capsular polysaccharide biosynthesis protein